MQPARSKTAHTPESLTALVANLTRDGERLDGEIWEMPIDDAFDTLNRLITMAREIRGTD